MNLRQFLQERWQNFPSHYDAYELVPNDSESGTGQLLTNNIPRRRLWTLLRYILSFLAAAIFLAVLYQYWSCSASHQRERTKDLQTPSPQPSPSQTPSTQTRLPPLFEEFRARERKLPQHNLSLPYPDGAHAKFLWASNHGHHFGWGNYMQEMVLSAYLAYAAQRAFVFDNYTWERGGPELDNWNGKPIPARIPLSAFISGPIIGGPMNDPNVPRAVSREYFFSVCPESDRLILDTRTIQDTFEEPPTAAQVVEKWVAALDEIESPCVELAMDSPSLFSYDITNTIRVLDVFPAMSASPILADFGWSPLVLGEFYANLRYFGSFDEDIHSSSPTATSIAPLHGLIALHIRRGDYETWCANTYNNRMSFTGFNSFPQLPDKYVVPPPRPEGDPGSPEEADNTRRRCLPTIPEIVEKVLAVAQKDGAPQLMRVYIMTNGAPGWLVDLKAALNSAYNWPDGVATSRDLELSWEGKVVSNALDMHVGQRAEVFIGNGFSSVTSNIVLLRMHNADLEPTNTHFW